MSVIKLKEIEANFKELEKLREHYVGGVPIVALRIDGRNFSKYCRKLKKPFDAKISSAMDAASVNLLKELTALAVYTQSDEITVFLNGFDLMFSGRVNKLLSVSASIAAVSVERHMQSHLLPSFDSRIALVGTVQDMDDYLVWRRLDSRKNAVNSAAHALAGPKILLNKSMNERFEILAGSEFEKIDEGDFNGRLVQKFTVLNEVGVLRNKIEVVPATQENTACLIDRVTEFFENFKFLKD